MVRGLSFRRHHSPYNPPYYEEISAHSEVSPAEYQRSWATKSGRHLKPSQIPGALEDYVDVYNALMLYQHQQAAMYGPPEPPAIDPWWGYAPMGGGGGQQGRGRGGGGQQGGSSSGNCGQHSLWWWGNQILDTGTPPGSSAPTAPAKLAAMGPIYASNNIIFENGACYFVKAQNGVAQGQRQPVRCTQFNHNVGGRGFAVGTPNPYSMMSEEAIQSKLAYRAIWAVTEYAQRHLADMIETGGIPRNFAADDPEVATALWARAYQGRGRGGGGGGGGGDAGQRMINCTVAGQSKRVAIDTGTDAILGAGNGSKQCVFDPNPSPISVPSTSHSQAPYYFMPAWNMSFRIRVCLTNQYTICQSLGQGGTIYYNARGGQKQTGEPPGLNGREWGISTPQQQQAPQIQQGRGRGDGWSGWYF